MKFFLSSIFVLILPLLTVGQNTVCINEYMVKNDSTLNDFRGKYPDWIELYNPTTKTVNLKGYYLSDDCENPKRWMFPKVKIDPDEFILVFASGQNEYAKKLHCNFRLKPYECIVFSDKKGNVLQKIQLGSPGSDISCGSITDGNPEKEQLFRPTPASSNNVVNSLEISHPSGFYKQNFPLYIKSRLGDTVRYTLDGSEPTASSPICPKRIAMTSLLHVPDTFSYIKNSPINLNPQHENFKANIVRACSFKNGKRSSNIYNRTIFVDYNGNSRYKGIELISILTDSENLFDTDSGIYVPGRIHEQNKNSGNYDMRGKEWERRVALEFFDKNGESRFTQNSGIRIHGNSREVPQKSLRLYARNKYGQRKFDLPFFDSSSTSYPEKLILRNSMSCWQKTLIKDDLTHFICSGLNFESQETKPVAVFINGEYWGIYSLREHMDEDYLAMEYDIPKDSVNIVVHGAGNYLRKVQEGIVAGTSASHKKLYDFLEQHHLADNKNYKKIHQYLDMESIIDYYCAQIFFNNRDWPGYNNKLWSCGKNGKWRQLFFDLDACWTNPETNTFAKLLSGKSSAPTPKYSKILFQKLMESDVFKTDFLNRLSCLMNREFSTEKLLSAIEQFENKYQPFVKEHLGRWPSPGSVAQWKRKLDLLRTFAKTRQAHVIEHAEKVFGRKFPKPQQCD